MTLLYQEHLFRLDGDDALWAAALAILDGHGGPGCAAVARRLRETVAVGLHSVRVCRIALHIAESVLYPDTGQVVAAALFHDAGKLLWPAELHHKVGLTGDDWRIIHAHPKQGAELLRRHVPDLTEPVLSAVLEHHERPGGTGYPNRLIRLSPLAEIVAAADSYEAQTSRRVYRRHPYTHEQAVDDIGRWCGRDVARALHEYGEFV